MLYNNRLVNDDAEFIKSFKNMSIDNAQNLAEVKKIKS